MIQRRFKHCRSNQKITTQILCFTFCMFTTILIVMFLSSYYLLTFSIYYLESSSQVSLNMENKSQISNLNNMLSSTLDLYIMRSAIQSQKLNEIFQQIQKYDIQTNIPIPCLNETLYPDQIEREIQFCYEYYGKKDSIEPKVSSIFMKLTSLLSQYLDELIITNYIYFSSINDDQYFSVYNISIYPEYQPKNREWYQHHLEHMNQSEIVVSDPFYQLSSIIRIAFTHNLTLLNKTLVGIGVKDLQFDNLPQFSNSNADIMIISQNGKIILNKFYQTNVSQIYCIEDENITGISKTQWLDLQNQLDNQLYCQGTMKKSIDNKEYSFAIRKLTYSPYYIMIQINNDLFKQDRINLISKYDNFQLEYFKMCLLVDIAGILTILLFQFVTFSYLEKNLNSLNCMAKKSLFQNYYRCNQQKYNNQQFSKIHVINKLYHSFLQLLNGIRQKNQFCSDLEKMKYPHNNLSYLNRGIITNMKTEFILRNNDLFSFRNPN